MSADAVDIQVEAQDLAHVRDLSVDRDGLVRFHGGHLLTLVVAFQVAGDVLEEVVIVGGGRADADVLPIAVDNVQVALQLHILALQGLAGVQRVGAQGVEELRGPVMGVGDDGFLLFRAPGAGGGAAFGGGRAGGAGRRRGVRCAGGGGGAGFSAAQSAEDQEDDQGVEPPLAVEGLPVLGAAAGAGLGGGGDLRTASFAGDEFIGHSSNLSLFDLIA